MSHFTFSKDQPWAQFARKSDSIFTEEFIQDKLFIFKTTQKPSRGIVKFKEMVSYVKGKPLLEEEVKVWLPIWNEGGSLFFRIKRNQVKALYDHGLRSYAGNLINFYGGIQSSKNFTNSVIKIGANLIGVNTSLDSRLRIVCPDTGKNQIASGHKFNWTVDNFTFDACQVFNLHSFSVFKNAMRIIYKLNDQQIYFKAENNTQRSLKNWNFTNLNSYFTNFAIDYVKTINKKTRIGVQFQFTKNGRRNQNFVIQHILDSWNSKIKAKISSSKAISLSYQRYLRTYGKWMVGWQLSDIGNKNQNKFGLMIDLHL